VNRDVKNNGPAGALSAGPYLTNSDSALIILGSPFLTALRVVLSTRSSATRTC
jgi:hypothetical protein